MAAARHALARAVESDAFRALPKVFPFAFFFTPGHDEPTMLALELRC